MPDPSPERRPELKIGTRPAAPKSKKKKQASLARLLDWARSGDLAISSAYRPGCAVQIWAHLGMRTANFGRRLTLTGALGPTLSANSAPKLRPLSAAICRAFGRANPGQTAAAAPLRTRLLVCSSARFASVRLGHRSALPLALASTSTALFFADTTPSIRTSIIESSHHSHRIAPMRCLRPHVP